MRSLSIIIRPLPGVTFGYEGSPPLFANATVGVDSKSRVGGPAKRHNSIRLRAQARVRTGRGVGQRYGQSPY